MKAIFTHVTIDIGVRITVFKEHMFDVSEILKKERNVIFFYFAEI